MATLTLSWQLVTKAKDGETEPGISVYNLYQGTAPTTQLTLVQMGLLKPTAIVLELMPGTDYFFAVSAVNSGVEGILSAVMLVRIPLPLAYNESEWWEEDPDDFHADDFGNDSLLIPAAPTGLSWILS